MIWHCHCGLEPCAGLDCGVLLSPPRKKPTPKLPEEVRQIRRKAWETRRQKYGTKGHK
jgi:hypothetical protein